MMDGGHDSSKQTPLQGDLLDGLSSTASSVFSNGNSSTMSHVNGAGAVLSTPTPATTNDSSPIRTLHSPKIQNVKLDREHVSKNDKTYVANGLVDQGMADAPASAPAIAKRVNPRPSPGEVKGRRIVFDPCLQPKTIKGHKASKPTYRDFGASVRFSYPIFMLPRECSLTMG